MTAPLRPFDTLLSPETWGGIQRGTLQTRYRDRACLKSPFDFVLYLQLIQRLRPATVIEIGVHAGGSALWFADTMRLHRLNPNVIGVDLRPPEDLSEPGVTLLKGDALALGSSMPDDWLRGLPHPWLVVEDSSHRFETSLAVLRFFDPWLTVGDYVVVEDGVVEFMSGPFYDALDRGPSRALTEFMSSASDRYELDTGLCDFFGHNMTYNPNGWLRRR